MINRKLNQINLFHLILYTFLIIFFASCNITSNLAPNEKLLTKNEVEITNKNFKPGKAGFKEKDIEQILKPKTNTKTLFSAFPLKLMIYNLADPEKADKKIAEKQKKCEKRKSRKRSRISGKLKKIDKKTKYLSSEVKKYNRFAKKISRLQNKADNLNLSTCESSHWTRKLGEPPVLYRVNDQYRNMRKIRIFLKEKGFYDVNIKVEKNIGKNKKKIELKYIITLGKQHKINNIYFDINDKNIKQIILKDTIHSYLKKGMRFDTDKIEKEQERLNTLIRNSGYYNFIKDYIHFKADTLNKNQNDDLYVIIKKDTLNPEKIKAFKKYIIKDVFIYPNFKPRKALSDKDLYFKSHDTLIYYAKNDNKYYFLYNETPRINQRAITKGIFITPEQTFNLNDINATYRYLASLPVIQIANIKFEEEKHNPEDSVIFLKCEIRLTQSKLQSSKTSIEISNTAGNIGIGGKLSYSNKNFFRNAEVLNLGVKLAFKRLTKTGSYSEISKNTFFNSREYGFNMSVDFPRLMIPVPVKKRLKKQNTKTILYAGYNFLERPDFSYTVAGGNISYNWHSSRMISHNMQVLTADVVELKNPSNDFLEQIKKLQLEETYETHFIFGSSYRFSYNNMYAKKKRNTFFFSVNSKLAGNSLYSVMKILDKPKTNGSYGINNIVFAQFLKEDIELRYHLKLKRENDKIAFRFFGGAAFPYGNLKVIPFGEKYFAGGANSIRAWQSRSLGPGSYINNDTLEIYPNQTADMRIEANAEYRMKLFGNFEGAIFLDAGNIWAINDQDIREGSRFGFDTFIDEIAVGTGMGLRWDLSFVLLRLDAGLKLRNPAATYENKWIPANRKFNENDWTLFFAIGYPF